MLDPDAIAEAASERLNVPAADLVESATAAIEYIAADISTTPDTLDETSALLFIGARLLTERIYKDVGTASNDLDPYGTPAMSGVFIPDDLGAHLRHFWTPQQMEWGIA